jgi:hypothetical protein
MPDAVQACMPMATVKERGEICQSLDEQLPGHRPSSLSIIAGNTVIRLASWWLQIWVAENQDLYGLKDVYTARLTNIEPVIR